VTGPVSKGRDGGDGVAGGHEPDPDEELDDVETAGETGEIPPLADGGSKLGADIEAIGVVGSVSSTCGTGRDTRSGSLIRPFCITILYHNLLLFIDIFHI
jgi:hypothetical protein